MTGSKTSPGRVTIFTGSAIFALTFLLLRPSEPATQGQIDIRKKRRVYHANAMREILWIMRCLLYAASSSGGLPGGDSLNKKES